MSSNMKIEILFVALFLTLKNFELSQLGKTDLFYMCYIVRKTWIYIFKQNFKL